MISLEVLDLAKWELPGVAGSVCWAVGGLASAAGRNLAVVMGRGDINGRESVGAGGPDRRHWAS